MGCFKFGAWIFGFILLVMGISTAIFGAWCVDSACTDSSSTAAMQILFGAIFVGAGFISHYVGKNKD